MEKSIFTREYGELLRLLREKRRAAGLSQVEFAQKLGQSQSFVSKCEHGDRRIDYIQLRTFCEALGVSVLDFVKELEDRLRKQGNTASPSD